MKRKIKNPTDHPVRITRIVKSSSWYRDPLVPIEGQDFYIVHSKSPLFPQLINRITEMAVYQAPEANGPWYSAWLFNPVDDSLIYVRGFTCVTLTDKPKAEHYAK